MLVLFQQLLIMVIIAGLGFYFGRSGLLSKGTRKDLSALLMRWVLPIMIMSSFLRPFSWEEAFQMGMIFILSVIMVLISITFATIFFRKDEVIERYACVFNNKGFMGIPAVTGLFGPQAVFYVTPTIMITNLFIWTYGMRLLRGGDEPINAKKLFLNPSSIGFLLGLFFYVMPFSLPTVITQALKSLTSINTPIAMLLLGCFLSEEPLAGIVTDKQSWKVSFFRLLAIPAFSMIAIYLYPFGDETFKYIMTVVWAAPVGLNLTMQAALAGRDPGYAARITSLTSLLSLFTMPLLYEAAIHLF